MKRTITKRGNSESGIVLIVCMILLLMLSMIGIISITTSNTESDISGNELRANESFYLADAGLERCLGILEDTVEWRYGFYGEPLGHGTYDVILTDSTSEPFLADRIRARSTGRVDEVVKTIEAYLKPVYNYPFAYGAYGRDSVHFGGNAILDSYDSELGDYRSQVSGNHAGENGPVGSEGTILLDGQADVYGNASTTPGGEILYGGGAQVYGDTTTNADPPEFPPITQEELDYARANNAASTGLILNGNARYNGGQNTLDVAAHSSVTFTSGVYFFSSVSVTGHGEILIAPGANVVIYMTGNWDSSGGTIINGNHDPSSFQLYSVGDSVLLAGGSEFYGCVYAPESSVMMMGGSDFYGSIVGATFNNGGGTQCHYDEALGRDITRGIARYLIEAWTEI
jgi:hypothetical protein